MFTSPPTLAYNGRKTELQCGRHEENSTFIMAKVINLPSDKFAAAGSAGECHTTYPDLLVATKNFSDKLGGGGFGSVYKGVICDSSCVALKKLERITQGEKELRSEVSTIGKIQRVNIIRLRGFRAEDCTGTARELGYLHDKCRNCIIHCDIKPENILLDADLHAHIADFGMAKLVVHGKRNTKRYDQDSNFTFFPSLAASVLMVGGDILGLIDSRLNRDASVDEVTKIFKVAYWCIQDEEDNRPSMSLVEQILEGVSDVNMPPIPKYVNYIVEKTDHDLFFTKRSSNGNFQSNFPSGDFLSDSVSSS
nr:G-type lectin S-receptor-like serine/threonine-protein kinase At2g19130 [Tanacetum cinerariifolium]